jgi:hypothetical protein
MHQSIFSRRYRDPLDSGPRTWLLRVAAMGLDAFSGESTDTVDDRATDNQVQQPDPEVPILHESWAEGPILARPSGA